MNKLKKIVSVIHRWVIKKEAYINVDVYNKEYTKYLKKIGINFTGANKTIKFIAADVYFDGYNYSIISIGDNVTISREVMLLTHDYSLTNAMASIGKGVIKRHEGEMYTLKGISIGDNCFIGARASILPGTTIGNNCIIGACCVVKGSIPDNSIVIGNPARIVGDTREYARKYLKDGNYNIEK